MATKREIKRAQVTLLVRIKNKLTPEQQAKLVEIRNKSGEQVRGTNLVPLRIVGWFNVHPAENRSRHPTER